MGAINCEPLTGSSRTMTTELERRLCGLRAGQHCCLVYESIAEQMAAVVPFVWEGLARKECCVYIGGDPSSGKSPPR